MTASVQQKSTLDGLPKQFVSAMRTLFDLMDDKQSGFVKFQDIENRWQEGRAVGDSAAASGGLPNGVIDSLRKVTPPNGLLSFERFCAGLRICLLRHDPSRRIESRTKLSKTQGAPSAASRPASVPLPERDNNVSRTVAAKPLQKVLQPSISTERLPVGVLSPHQQSRMVRPSNTATVRPNNVNLVQQRAVSMPHLQQTSSKSYQQQKREESIKDLTGCKNDQKLTPALNRAKVALALERWRMMKSYHQNDESQSKDNSKENVQSTQIRPSASYPKLRNTSSDGDNGVSLRIHERGPAAKKASRRREPRRHTVSNGIDYNMIKRLKLLEQEKDILLQGLDAVERARNWYIQQITAVSDRLEQVSKWDTPHSEYSMDAHHERLNFQMTRIFEVNQHLNALMESSEKGFPIHMNLAVHQRPFFEKNQKNSSQTTIQRLKEQNHSLTEEIGKKSEIIAQLEAEKSALIRELFQSRAQQKKDSNDTTLW